MKKKIKGCTHHESKVVGKFSRGGAVKAPPPVGNAMRMATGGNQAPGNTIAPPPPDGTTTNISDTTKKPAFADFNFRKEVDRFNRKIENGTLDKKYGFYTTGRGSLGNSMGLFMYMGDRLSKMNQPKKKDDK